MANSLTKDLPKITYKQQELIGLLYKYRFLNRIQLQAFIKHKDYKRINVWLKDLTAKQYAERIYSTDFVEKTKPAVYYLGINGIRYLKTLNDETINHAPYPSKELRKRYREAERSQTYRDSCSLIADCALAIENYNHSADAAIHEEPDANGYTYRYFYEVEAEYQGDSFYHELADSEYVRPQLCIARLRHEGSLEPVTDKSFVLEVIEANLPRYRMKKRMSNYVEFLSSGEWDELFGAYNEPAPACLFVCPRTTDLIYTKRHMRHLLAEEWERDDEDRPNMQFTTVEKLKTEGFFGTIWEKA